MIVDSRGRRVPFSAAGFVLRPGQVYRVRIRVPSDPDFDSVRLQALLDYIRIDQETQTTDDRGQPVREIPFRVRQEREPSLFRPGAVACDDLGVVMQFRTGSGKPAVQQTFPIVVRPGWGFTVSAVITAGVSIAAAALVPELLSGEKTHGVSFWLYGGILLAAGLLGMVGIAWAVTYFQLRQRAKDLRDTFEDKYPPLEQAVSSTSSTG
jgi:hypothetical protein